ncbi:uncharacterized protein LOC18421577 isoform X1 [Amborella trichopoda]|uniref:Uncharacterized protein n=1 Tax=Amborella trichopoda TaxID=13333 RepID=W1NDJ2_AMBTC|nr:uncharacterized protein LOC18421577 isoform X1 [Amborella trichopoda]ERM93622.1 hypothetical protein AMTR_s00004p00142010 [Amborella trichopoda]|eukprot:XP_006826385.1 uncharacterized protein LOC18421577 isoform X1 [Amborella trichopoda]
MEESISAFCNSLGGYCKQLQSSCDALKDSINRRPIPLKSASSTFVECLNRKVTATSEDLNLLESMVIDTVSFEELLGYCHQVYINNQNDILELEDHLRDFGYVPGKISFESMSDEENEAKDTLASDFRLGSTVSSPLDESNRGSLSFTFGLAFEPESFRKRLQEDDLLEDFPCLQDIGLSDACLATLASTADDDFRSPEDVIRKPPRNIHFLSELPQQAHMDEPLNLKASKLPPPMNVLNVEETIEAIHSNPSGELRDEANTLGGGNGLVISIVKGDYDKLPSYLKFLASWEDVNEAVTKMNSVLKQSERNMLYEDEFTSGTFGPKGKSCLLLLMRMNQVAVEPVQGKVTYRLVVN